MRALPKAVLAKKNSLEFATVSEAAKKYQPVAVLHCPHVMSWADEERDVTAWLGNELQNEAFSKLYAQKEKVAAPSSDTAPWSAASAAATTRSAHATSLG